MLAKLPDQQTVCGAAARNLKQAIPTVIAIIAPKQHQRAKILEELNIPVSICKQSSQGMAATLAFGIQSSTDSDGWIISLADMPYIQPKTIHNIYLAMKNGASIAAPHYQGKRGHPVGFASKFKSELISLNGDKGAHQIIEKNKPVLVRLDTNDAGILKDIDVRADVDFN